MCGIIGTIGPANAWPLVMAGLKRLQYRGYDSAGVATVHRRRLKMARRVGALSSLEADFPEGLPGTVGIGHTRWATHGAVTEGNCHPHADAARRLAVVHNGIIENADELRRQVGGTFRSETDTEVLAALIAAERPDAGSLLEAVRRAIGRIQGTAGLLVISADEPDRLIAARIGSPLVVGLTDGAAAVASDPGALVGGCRRMVVLEEGELAEITAGDVTVIDAQARRQHRPGEPAPAQLPPATPAPYPHFYLRELHEQPASITRAISGRLDPSLGTARLGGLDERREALLGVERICLLGCGSSLHAARVGRFLLEGLARLPCSAEQPAELLDRNPIVDPRTLYVAISQSGETADILMALRELQLRGATVAGITNAVGSTLARETDCGVYLHAGPEISVASTKSFTSQVAVVALLALRFARMRGLPAARGRALVAGLSALPEAMQTVLDRIGEVQALAASMADAPYVLFVGRGVSLSVAQEGALKYKELTYRPAEGLSGAEAKHGTLAMIEPGTPVWALAPPDETRARMHTSMAELRSRGARLLVIAGEDDDAAARLADTFIGLPPHHPSLSPLLTALPLQLVAYHTALHLGRNIDQPRNLAKSVTVA